MEPVTLSIVSGVLFWGYDRLRARAAADPNNVPDPPVLDEAVVNQGTHCLGPVRVFDHDISKGLEVVLARVSAVRIDGGPLGREGHVYRILPLKLGEPTAADVLRHARAAVPNCVVVASLTLPILFLPLAQSKPAMIMVIAPPGSEGLAGRDGHFAVLLNPPAKLAPKEAAPAPAPTPAPAAVVTPPPAGPFPPPPVTEVPVEQLTVDEAIRRSVARSNGEQVVLERRGEDVVVKPNGAAKEPAPDLPGISNDEARG